MTAVFVDTCVYIYILAQRFRSSIWKRKESNWLGLTVTFSGAKVSTFKDNFIN